MPRSVTVTALTSQHQQVLAFVSAHLRDNGYLPATRELAAACGFGSPHTAARLLSDLESLGALRRDARYHRLAVVTADWDVAPIPEQEQLWWCEVDRIEHETAVAAVRRGIELTPDLEAAAGLYSEVPGRIRVLRALDVTRRCLLEGGVMLNPEAEADLAAHRRIAEASGDLLTDWESYCAVRLVWNLSADDALGRVPPAKLGYLGSALVAATRTIRRLLPGYQADARRPVVRERLDSGLSHRLTQLLCDLRRVHARQCPSHPDRVDVDVEALLEGVPER